MASSLRPRISIDYKVLNEGEFLIERKVRASCKVPVLEETYYVDRLIWRRKQKHSNEGRSLTEYQNQAKQLFRKISTDPTPPARCSLESGTVIFHYYIERGVCYLVLCDQNFSKRLAYAFLEDLQTEFASTYGPKVETVARPYSFIEFDTYIKRVRKNYMDSRARKNLSSINSELQDVQRIMVQNIDDVLRRGDSIAVLDNKASNLSELSSKYKKDAKYLNLRSSYAKIAAIVIIVIVFLLFVRFWII